VDPNELVLELPGGATSLETALLPALIDQRKEAELRFLLGRSLGKATFSAASAASVANKDFVFLTWAVVSENRGNYKLSLTYPGKSVNMVHSDNTNTRFIRWSGKHERKRHFLTVCMDLPDHFIH